MPLKPRNNPVLELLATGRPLVIGHRGYCALAPENTLPSFRLAIEAGADLVELDYHHSKDGIPIAFHDANLDRTTNARTHWRRRRIRTREKTAAEIQTLDAGRWFDANYAGAKVPLLSEALEFIEANGSLAVIERKSGDAQTCARILRERKLIGKVVVMSFDWKFLRALHDLEPAVLLGALGPPSRYVTGRRPRRLSRRLRARWLDEMLRSGAQIAVWNRQVSPRAVGLAHQRGLNVWVYTVNDPRRARRLAAFGVGGIITNRVSLIRTALTWL